MKGFPKSLMDEGLVAAAFWWASFIPGFISTKLPPTLEIYQGANLSGKLGNLCKFMVESFRKDENDGDDSSGANTKKSLGQKLRQKRNKKPKASLTEEQCTIFIEEFVKNVKTDHRYRDSGVNKISSDYNPPSYVVEAAKTAGITDSNCSILNMPWKKMTKVFPSGQVFLRDKEIFTPSRIRPIKFEDLKHVKKKSGEICCQIFRVLEISPSQFDNLLQKTCSRENIIDKIAKHNFTDLAPGDPLYYWFESKNIKGGEEFLKNATDEELLQTLTDRDKMDEYHLNWAISYYKDRPELNKKKSV